VHKVNTTKIVELTWSSPKGKFSGAGKEISEALGRKPESTDLNERHPFDVEILRIPPKAPYSNGARCRVRTCDFLRVKHIRCFHGCGRKCANMLIIFALQRWRILSNLHKDAHTRKIFVRNCREKFNHVATYTRLVFCRGRVRVHCRNQQQIFLGNSSVRDRTPGTLSLRIFG
jgi:hypothetical protein